MPAHLPELDNILHSGSLAYGKWGKTFEQSIKNFIGCQENVLIVNSYTAAIHVALSTLGIKAGDEIIASPQSCLASTMPLASYGAKVIWADIDPCRGTLCPESVESKITGRTKIIFHNHHCSYPGYIDEINAIGKKHGIIVIDDCIEAFGSKYKGRLLGNLDTDVTLFSFQTVRLPNTIDGGAIIFKDHELYEKAVCVRDLGVNRTTFRDALGEINPASDVPFHGYGVTMNEVCSYIGYCQIQDLADLFAKQRSNAMYWNNIITNSYPYIKMLNITDVEPTYWVFGILTDNKIENLNYFRSKGYHCSGVHVPNTFYSVFDKMKLKGVQEFYSKFLALPCGWWININSMI